MTFIAAGIDAAEGPQALSAYKEAQGYPWQVALAGREVIERYNVVSTSIKYGVDRNGVVAYHAGYGVSDEARWRAVFDELAGR